MQADSLLSSGQYLMIQLYPFASQLLKYLNTSIPLPMSTALESLLVNAGYRLTHLDLVVFYLIACGLGVSLATRSEVSYPPYIHQAYYHHLVGVSKAFSFANES